VRWGGLGAFAKPAKATVLWVGPTSGVDELRRLSVAVGESLVVAGLPAIDRPFRPHLTLARIRPPLDVTDLIASCDPLEVAMTVERIDLMATRFGGSVAGYDVIESFALR
jgi:2'-5' RNA ligase